MVRSLILNKDLNPSRMGRSINVASALKLYGYSIQREASEILASELRNIGPSEHDKWYDDLGRVF